MGVVHSCFSRACPLLEEVRTRLSHLAMSFYAIRGTSTRHRLQEPLRQVGVKDSRSPDRGSLSAAYARLRAKKFHDTRQKPFCQLSVALGREMIGDILSNQSYVLGLLGIFQMTVEDWLPVKVRRAAIDRELKTNETLFRLGSKAVGMYEVISGRVRLCRVDSTGREIVLHVAGPGETLAEASLYSAEYHCDAVANTDATVRFFPKRELLAAFEMNPKTAQAFTKMLAHQVMRLRTSIEQRNIRSARERVRHFLALNVGPDSRTVRLRGTLKDLAAEIGLTHEALYRTLAALEVSGEIRRKGRIIVLSKRI